MQDTPTASFALAEGRISAPEMGGASIALQRSVRALEGVDRIGRLQTLDLKSNDIRVSRSASFSSQDADPRLVLDISLKC